MVAGILEMSWKPLENLTSKKIGPHFQYRKQIISILWVKDLHCYLKCSLNKTDLKASRCQASLITNNTTFEQSN